MAKMNFLRLLQGSNMAAWFCTRFSDLVAPR